MMNIIRIAWKEMKHDFRDVRTLFFMLLFPVVLMLVLGTALTGAFNNDLKLDDVHVFYQNTNKDLVQPFEALVKGAKESGIEFEPAAANDDGKALVKEGKADGYAVIDKSGIRLFVNDQGSLEASVLQGMLASFADRYNLTAAIMQHAPKKAGNVWAASSEHDYIKDHTLQANKQPGSMDYYAVVMTTMIALYAAMAASYMIIGERSRNTATRLLISPIHKRDIFIGKLLGSIVMNMVCLLLVVCFSMAVFHANWGDHLGLVMVVLLTEVIFAVSLGIGLSYLIKSPAGPKTVIMIAVQLASFFGGAYFPIEDAGGILKFVSNLSPLTHNNQTMFSMIYANDLSDLLPAITMNIGLAFIFLLIAMVSLRRREGL